MYQQHVSEQKMFAKHVEPMHTAFHTMLPLLALIIGRTACMAKVCLAAESKDNVG